eukprot:983770-Amphidinium_carterae.3
MTNKSDDTILGRSKAKPCNSSNDHNVKSQAITNQPTDWGALNANEVYATKRPHVMQNAPISSHGTGTHTMSSAELAMEPASQRQSNDKHTLVTSKTCQ